MERFMINGEGIGTRHPTLRKGDGKPMAMPDSLKIAYIGGGTAENPGIFRWNDEEEIWN
jgi:hypothetical protein